MFDSFLAVPLHFTVEFLGFLVCAGGAFLVLTRGDLIPGPHSNRVTAALGLGVLAAAQVAHGGSFLPLEGDELLIAVQAIGFALVGVAISGSVRPTAGAFLGLPIKQPLSLAPGAAALFVAIAAAAGATKGKHRGFGRLAAACLLLAAAHAVSALAPATAFGIGESQTETYAAHAVRMLGFLLLASWLWTGVRSSIRVRFVASFAALLIVVVLVLSSALTGVISSKVEEQQLATTSSQLTGVVRELTQDDVAALTDLATSIARADTTRTLVSAGRTGALEANARTHAGEPSNNLSFVVFLDRRGRILAHGGRGPAFTRNGRRVETKLDAPRVLAIVGSRVVRSLVEKRATVDSAASPSLIGTNAVALVAAAEVTPVGSRRPVGAVVVGRFVDAFETDVISATLRPSAVASLIVEGRVVASDLPPAAAARLKVPREVAQEIAFDNAAAVDQPLGTRTYFNAFAPMGQGVDDAVLVLSSPARIVGATRDEVTGILFTVAIGIGAVVLILAWLSGRRITRPIQRLTLAAGAVREGDLTVRADVAGDDEVGQLGETFNDMTAALLRTTNDLRDAAAEEQRLRSRIETIVQSMAEGLVAVDADLKILAFNPQVEALTGIGADSALGKPVQSVMDTRDSEGNKVSLPIYELTEGSLDGVYLAHRSGDLIPVSVDTALLRDAEGNTAGGVAVVRDMTREREVERMKSEFLSNISHELRTPLTPIKGYAQLLARSGGAEDKAEQFAGGILESTAKLERIVELLVDFSALGAGRLAPRSKPVDVGELVQQLADRAGGRTNRHDVVVNVRPRLPKVMGDERLLRRSLEEVLDNAIKFSPDGGTVKVEARGTAQSNGRKRRSVEVTISDEGIGIPPEDVEKIFSDFRQLDGSETRTYGGLGLGLAFVRRIVAAHDGSVEVESEPDRGTKLIIKIPAVQRQR